MKLDDLFGVLRIGTYIRIQDLKDNIYYEDKINVDTYVKLKKIKDIKIIYMNIVETDDIVLNVILDYIQKGHKCERLYLIKDFYKEKE